MDSVSISAHEVEQAAASLSRMNQQLRAHLDAVTQKMRQLSSCWDSPAGAALQERYHAAACNGLNYARAAEGTTDPCLASLLEELSDGEYRQANALLAMLERSLRG